MATRVRSRLRRRIPRLPVHVPPRMRNALALLLVVVAAAAGGLIALVSFREDRRLSVGTVTLSVTPFHRGALDLYVPLVDWGVRFRSVRFPARVHVDVRSVNRKEAAKIAGGADVDVRGLRREANHEIGSYLRALLAVVLAASLAAGLAAAFAMRSRAGPRLGWLVGAAVATSAIGMAVLVITLPPRGQLGEP